MNETSKIAMFYKEDVAKILHCSNYVALNYIKSSGHCVKIGKRYAIPVGAFFAILRGQKYNGIECRTVGNFIV